MANKKISELESRASLSLSDLMAVGDPSTGYLYKTTISDLKTLTGAGVVSFNGRFGTVNPAEGDYTLTQLGDVIITTPSNGQVLQYNGSNWVNTTLPADNDTLDIVTGRGNTTANSITVGSVSAAGLSNLLGQIRTFATTGNTYIGANPGSATDAGYKLDVNGTMRATSSFYGTQIFTGAHSFRNETYITATTDGWTKQSAYNAANAYTLGFIGDLRFAPSTTIKAVFSFNGSYSNNGTIYHGDSSLIKIFTGDAMGNTVSATNINGYGINLMPTLNYTTGTSNFTGIYYNPTLTATTGLTHYAMNLVAGLVRMGTLAGTGSRMVVADASGNLSTQAIPTSAVTSVFGRTGAVVAASGDYTTTQVTEGTNLYYTDARARAAISAGTGISYNSTTGVVSSSITQYTDALARAAVSLTTSGSSGAATYNSTTGVFNIPTYTLAGLGGQPALNGTGFVKISGTTISYDNSTYLTTSSAASTYLPLAGGTLTGGLVGTTATFSGDIIRTSSNAGSINEIAVINTATTGTSSSRIRISTAFSGGTTLGDAYTQYTDNNNFNWATGSGSTTSRDFVITNYFTLGTNVVLRLAASTGAATFSSSVTATQFIVGSATTSTDVSIRFKADTGDFSLITDRGSHAFGIYDHQVAVYRMYVNSSGAIGIGRTDATKRLDIYDANASGTDDIVRAYQNLTTNHAFYRSQRNGGANMLIGATRDNVDGTISANVSMVWNASNHDMVFGTNGTERFRIAAGGAATFSSNVTSSTYFFRAINPATESGIETSLITTGNGDNQRAGIFATNNYASDLSTSLIFKTNASTGSATTRLTIASTGAATFSVNTNASLSITNSGQTPIISFRSNSVSDAGKIRVDEAFGGGEMVFSTKTTGGVDTDRMMINASGNVGINTINPGAKLHVAGTVEANGSLYRAVFGTTVQDADMTGITGGNGSELQIQSASTTRGAFLTLGGGMAFGEAMGGIAFYNSNNVDGKRCRAFIVGGQEGATAGEQGSYLSFGTVDNTGTVPSERIKITRSGNVEITTGSIKTGSPSGGTAQPWKLGSIQTGTCVPSPGGGFTSWFTGTVIQVEIAGVTYTIPAVNAGYC